MRENRMTGRSTGIDLLRILCMWGVVVFHIFDFGIGFATEGTAMWSAWLLRAMTFGAVECYGMISGYVLWKRKIHLRNWVMLWLQVAFYSLLIWGVFRVFMPQYLGKGSFLKALFPVSNSQYWYFSAYTGLFVLMPLLNAGVRNISERTAGLTLLGMLVWFSPITAFTRLDPFQIFEGTSMIWLILLYLFGALIGRSGVLRKLSSKKLWLIWAACILTAWLSRPVMSRVSELIYHDGRMTNRLIDHQSPLMLISSGVLVEIFARMKTGRLTPMIRTFAPLTFGVYLIHVNPLIWNNLLPRSCMFLLDFPWPVMVLMTLLLAAAVLAAGMAVDAVRLWLFGALRLKERITRVEQKILGS